MWVCEDEYKALKSTQHNSYTALRQTAVRARKMCELGKEREREQEKSTTATRWQYCQMLNGDDDTAQQIAVATSHATFIGCTQLRTASTAVAAVVAVDDDTLSSGLSVGRHQQVLIACSIKQEKIAVIAKIAVVVVFVGMWKYQFGKNCMSHAQAFSGMILVGKYK